MQRTGRSLDRIGIDRHTTFRWNHNGIYTRTLTGAGYRSEVAHISHPIQQDNKRIFSLLIHKGNDVFQPLISNGRHECDHTLVVLACETIQALLRHPLHRNRSSSQHLHQPFGQLTLQLSLDQDLVYLFIRLNGLHHGTNAKYHLVFLHYYALF